MSENVHSIKEYPLPTTASKTSKFARAFAKHLDGGVYFGAEESDDHSRPQSHLGTSTIRGAPVTVVDPETQTEYVVVRADLYERVKSLVEADDLSSEEKRLLLADSGKRAGWDRPEMDDYDDYDAHRSKEGGP